MGWTGTRWRDKETQCVTKEGTGGVKAKTVPVSMGERSPKNPLSAAKPGKRVTKKKRNGGGQG